jgi:DNA-binding response OmpR family regulator
VTISVLLVDDADDLRVMLRLSLRARGDFDVVGEAATGTEAVELAGQLQPDVIVLDLGLPDLAGKDLLARVRRTAPTSRIVIFSGSDTDRTWFERRSAGYVLKDQELDQLVELLASVGREQEHDQAAVDLPMELVAVREARAVVREMLDRWSLGDLADDATLVVTELVANAIEHAHTDCQLGVARTSNGIRLEVRDAGSGTPEPRPPNADAEDGRGLLIIAALSTAWGIEEAPHGKTVWVELALPEMATGT